MRKIITRGAVETKKLGGNLAGKILNPGKASFPGLFRLKKTQPLIICLEGDLGSGKTTFAQGLLKKLGTKGPYTSPTFAIMKEYKVPDSKGSRGKRKKIPLCDAKGAVRKLYHIDAYRIKTKDLLNLGWKELTAGHNNVIIIEWADRVRKIIPREAVWIKFKWQDNNQRLISFSPRF